MVAANKKISELTDGAPPAAGDVYPFARASETLSIDYADLLTALTAAIVPSATAAVQTTTTVATTDATVTTIATIPIPTDKTVAIFAEVVARRTGGAAGTTGDGAGYQSNAVAKNIAGTVTIIGQGAVFAYEDQAGWAVTITVSTTNILIRVTGAIDNNISWGCTYRTSQV